MTSTTPRFRRPNNVGTVFYWSSRGKWAAELEVNGKTVRRTARSESDAHHMLERMLAAAGRKPDVAAKFRPDVGTSVVYFLRAECSERLIKIGQAVDLPLRLGSVGTMSPVALTLLGTIPGGRDLEAALHLRFAHCRHHGEWFEPRKELLAYIDQWVDKPGEQVSLHGQFGVSGEVGTDTRSDHA